MLRAASVDPTKMSSRRKRTKNNSCPLPTQKLTSRRSIALAQTNSSFWPVARLVSVAELKLLLRKQERRFWRYTL